MEYAPETALAYARSMARPRLVGSSEDQAVAAEIANRLGRFGYQVEYQAFRFSTAVNTFLALEILTGLALILLTFWVRGVATWASGIPAALSVALFLLIGPLNRSVQATAIAPDSGQAVSRWSALCLRIARQYSTANLVASLPNRPDNPALPYLYLSAHYDSKSQRMPLVIRIALFVILIGCGLVFAGVTLLQMVFPALAPVAQVVGGVALLAGVPLLFLDVGNDSPGAIDDASGVGVVLHLAECLAQRPEVCGRLNLTVLILGAEELAVMGAAAYVRRHEAVLRRQAKAGALHVLNFDGPGVDGKLYLVSGDSTGRKHQTTGLGSRVKEACAELGVPLGKFSLPGASFDHIPFAQLGFDAVSLIAIGRATRAIHTSGDSTDKLHVRGFAQAGQVALKVIEKLASR